VGVDVIIRNKKLIRKPLTISDVAGRYAYGHMDDFFRYEEGLIKGTNIVFDKEHIGRGFEFDWTGDDKNEIHLRLNFLATIYDIHIFYECIRNIMIVWGTKSFVQDDITFKLSEIPEIAERACQDNNRYLSMQKDMSDKYGTIIILGAMNPVYVEPDMISDFVARGDSEGYAKMLHDKQAQDLYYAVPKVYRVNNGAFFGNYSVTATADSVFPITASDPMFFKNPDTGEGLKCSFFSVSLCSLEKDAIVGRISFDDFKKEVDLESLPRYDATHVILRNMTEERIAQIVEKNYPDPLDTYVK
jgi:hypothetical protein